MTVEKKRSQVKTRSDTTDNFGVKDINFFHGIKDLLELSACVTVSMECHFVTSK